MPKCQCQNAKLVLVRGFFLLVYNNKYFNPYQRGFSSHLHFENGIFKIAFWHFMGCCTTL